MKVDKKQLEGTVEFLELTCRGLPDSAWRQYRYAINTLRAVLTDGVEFEDRTDSTWWLDKAEGAKGEFLPEPKNNAEVSALISAWWQSGLDSEVEANLANAIASLARMKDQEGALGWLNG